jgi:hypothetical protein
MGEGNFTRSAVASPNENAAIVMSVCRKPAAYYPGIIGDGGGLQHRVGDEH